MMWENLIRQDSTVCDIGANIGYYSLIAAHKACLGSVFSFEPSSYLFDQLCSNIKLNNFKNITPYNLALSDQTGKADFFPSTEDNLGMAGLHPAENFSGSIETIHTINFQEWKEKELRRKVNFIKIDVEGMEMKVLSGMNQVLDKERPVLFIEVIDQHLRKNNSSILELFEFLWKKQYNGFEITGLNILRKTDIPIESDTVIFAPKEYYFPLLVKVKQ